MYTAVRAHTCVHTLAHSEIHTLHINIWRTFKLVIMLLFKFLMFYVFCQPVCAPHACSALRSQKRAVADPLEVELIDDCKPLCGCWGSNLGLL